MSLCLPHPDPIVSLPIVLLMIKSRCDCRCSMCDIWRNTSGQELSESLIAKLLPQLDLLRTREIVLTGGEPLMHSEIESLCRILKASHLKLTLLTTGLLLKHHARWVSECVDQIYVSLDGPETIHNEIRHIPNAFSKIAAGIDALRQYNSDMSIGARSTVHGQNFQYLSATVDAAKQLGFDNISFLAADVQSGHFGRANLWEENKLALSPDQLHDLRATLDHLYIEQAEAFEQGFIVETKAKLERKLYGYYQALARQGDFPEIRCNAPWVSTVIETDGRVRPCFFHAPFQGDVKQQPLTDILNSDLARDWRQQLDIKSDSVCQSCVCSLALVD